VVSRLTALAATPVVAIALVAAGCGGSSPTAASQATTSTTATAGGGSAETAAFRACLAKAGIKLPSGFGNARPPQGGPGQAPPGGAGQTPPNGRQPSVNAKQRRAFASCQSKLPAGARAGGFPRGGQSNPALAKYTSCLRKHGVTFGGSSNQSAFKKANAACAKYAPAAGG
jgi:hypothetical protein